MDTNKPIISKHSLREWESHPITKLIRHILTEEGKRESYQTILNTNPTKGIEINALSTSRLKGKLEVYNLICEGDLLREQLIDNHVIWAEDLDK